MTILTLIERCHRLQSTLKLIYNLPNNNPTLKGAMRYKAMKCFNEARRDLALAIRDMEVSLNRPHRYLPKLGRAQYLKRGNTK